MSIRWGMIGCGNVTEVKSGPGFQKCEGSELVAVMRRTRSLAEDYARRHRVPRWYDDADALIRDPDVDAIYIATPPGSHRDYALRACAAGKPVYVEKPMARNTEECREMVRAFQAAGRELFVAYYRRALPRFLKAKEILDAGALGTLTGVHYRYARPPQAELDPRNLPWRLNAEEAGGGLFFDLGSHALDILDFLLGPLGDVSGSACNRASPYDVEDSVVMAFRTRSGVPGVAAWNFVGSTQHDQLEIAGTAAALSLSVFGSEPVQLIGPEGTEFFDLPNPPHIQQPLIQTVVDELLGQGQCPSTGESGERTARVMDAVVENYYGSRRGDFWNRPEEWPGRRESGGPSIW